MARDFDGSNQSVDFGDIPAIDDATVLSMSAWAREDDITGDHAVASNYNGEGFILWADDTAATSGRTDTWTWYVAEDAGSGGTSARLEAATNSHAADTWQHVFGSFTANASGGSQFWKDGVEDANSPIDTTNIANVGSQSTSIRAGERPDGSMDRNGKLAELAFWNRVLTDAEIVQLSKGYSPMFFPNGLIHYSPLIGDGILTVASTSSAQNDGASSITWEHIIAAGNNRLLVVCIATEDNNDLAHLPVTGVTFNGDDLTKAVSEELDSGEQGRSEIWYRIAPDVATADIVVSFTGTIDGCVVSGLGFTGADQDTQPDVTAGNSDNAQTTATVSATPAVQGTMLVDCMNGRSSGTSITVGAGQTERFNITNSGQLVFGVSTEVVPDKASTAMTWTMASNDYTLATMGVRPIPAYRSEKEIINGNNGSIIGATKFAHPPIIYPNNTQVRRADAAIASSATYVNSFYGPQGYF